MTWTPYPLSLVSGSSRYYTVTLVDEDKNPVNLAEASNIVWLVINTAGVPIITKHFADNSIVITNSTAGQCLITLSPADTAPVANQWGYTVGSTTRDMEYTHETRLYLSDGTQDVPGSFRGPFTVYHTDTWGVE